MAGLTGGLGEEWFDHFSQIQRFAFLAISLFRIMHL